MNPEVVALGEPLLEFNAIQAGSLSEVRGYEVGWGGDTSNFAVAATRLGARVGYLTRLGDDDFGRIFLDLWQQEGVDASQVVIEPDSPTGIYFISRRGAVHSFTYYRKDSAASHLSPADIPAGYIQGAKVFHTSGITQAISASACDAAFHAIQIARQAGVTVSYDPNVRLKLWGADRARAIILETIRLSDYVFPSLEDAELITGLTDPQAIAASLLELAGKAVVLKLGERGALLATRSGFQRIDPYSVNVLDTSGAGDTFDGAFIAALLQGKSLEDCVRYATAAAALTTTGWGAVTHIPRPEQVEALLAATRGSGSG